MKNRLALIVGRFQPFHKGHLFLIKKALEEANKIIIGIGSANIIDENNPIDFETRKKIIKAVFYKEKIENRLLEIVPLDDYYDDKKWLKNVRKQVGNFDIVVSNNDWTNQIMEKAGFKVARIPYYKRELYEGWRIRKLIKDNKVWQSRVPKYLVDFVSNYTLHPTTYNLTVLGGTFDHFHKGHEALLTKAFEVGKKVTIGIATEEIYKNKLLASTIEDFSTRKINIIKFISLPSLYDRKKNVKIIPFSEFTGGTDKIREIDAIIVSRETLVNAMRINELRIKNKLRPLKIVIIEDILAEDGKLISSERIRSGEIDRNGKVFRLSANHYPLTTSDLLIMPENLRPKLQKPLGKVFKTVHKVIKFIKFIKPIQLIAVGDIIVDSLLKTGIDPDVKVIDFRSRREKFSIFNFQFSIKSKILNLKKNKNKPGTINLKTAEKLRQMILKSISHPQGVKIQQRHHKGDKNSWLIIDGEEDLLALPAILFAPLGSLVLYGHWQWGIVGVEVTEEKKEEAMNILEKFK